MSIFLVVIVSATVLHRKTIDPIVQDLYRTSRSTAWRRRQSRGTDARSRIVRARRPVTLKIVRMHLCAAPEMVSLASLQSTSYWALEIADAAFLRRVAGLRNKNGRASGGGR